MNIKKIEIKKLKNFFGNLPRITGEHAFLAFFILFLLSVLIGGFIFYKYGVLIEKREISAGQRPLQFNDEAYQRVVAEWENRKKRSEEADSKEYPDPFKEIYPQGTKKQIPTP